MRIGLLAPITHPLPPPGYGPWEQVVCDLADGLTKLGHQVTVFAAGGSVVSGSLFATVPHPLEAWSEDADHPPDSRIWEEVHIAAMAEEVARGGYDLVHTHLSVHPLGYAALLPAPMVVTLHGVGWNRATHPALTRYRHLPYVSLSDAERRFLPELNYVATVHNGVRPDDFPIGSGAGGYLLSVGRIAPEKAPHLAIEVAERAGRRLILAGPVEDKHRAYFEEAIASRLHPGVIDYLGPLSRVELSEVYREASALVVPLAWEEPFGLVAAEAMMSGTPVVAWRRGALPELIRDGVSGLLVDDVEAAVEAVSRVDRLDRTRCRADAEERLGSERMAAGYEAVYRSVVGTRVTGG